MTEGGEGPRIIERAGLSKIKLILCGQGPVIEKGTAVKAGALDEQCPGIVEHYGANTWMRFIARAAGVLDKRGEVDVIIPSGRATGGKIHIKDELGSLQEMEPTEASLMLQVAERVYGQWAPQSKERFLGSEVYLEEEARNTIYNVINAADIIDAREMGKSLDKLRQETYLLGTHFHEPRIKLLASLLGFDPKHVLSAEETLLDEAQRQEKDTLQRGEVDDKGFIKSRAMQKLIRTRVQNDSVQDEEEEVGYYKRKKLRAERLLDRMIERILNERDLKGDAREAERQRLKKSLFIEEGKEIEARMRGERRWTRGLIEVPETYLIPLAGLLKSDERLLHFLGQFDEAILAKVGIDLKTQKINEMRAKLDPKKWDWQVVKQEWENEEYPQETKDKLKKFGLSDSEVECLSSARVPSLS